jgi:choline dehydrogenase-like flavoprotein
MESFPLAHDDRIMQARLREADITLHTTPQARTRTAYDDRAGCMNFGTCRYCPIGARYSPNYHLAKAVDTGNCTVITDATVRRVVPDQDGRGGSVIYRTNDQSNDQEYHADVIVVAAGAVESARLLLLSRHERHPDGLGNAGGWVGRGLAFHHVWKGRLHYDIPLYPFRFGGWTGQSLQFIDASTRGEHAAVKVEFSSRKAYDAPLNWSTAQNPYDALIGMLHWRQIILQAEAPASSEKYITLSPETDRFGDPFAHIHYRFTDFDVATYEFAREVFDRFVAATGPTRSEFPPLDWWDSGSHHMGTCRMGTSVRDSVVNSFGQVHGLPHIFVIGGSNFVGSSGAMNPTLTMVALAIRSADFILDML